MPVPSTIADLSTVIASNSPAGSDAVTSGSGPDEYIRALSAIIKRLELPVGSIYTNAADATNPATLLGYGTWTAFGTGRVLVGIDAADTSFDLLGETGGSKDAIAVAHTHTFSATTGGQSATHSHGVTDPGHAHNVTATKYNGGQFNYYTLGTQAADVALTTSSSTTGITLGNASNDHNHGVSGTTASSGSAGTNANLQPYVVVHMWKRTA